MEDRYIGRSVHQPIRLEILIFKKSCNQDDVF